MSDPSNMFDKLDQHRQEIQTPVSSQESDEAKKPSNNRRRGKRGNPEYQQINPYIPTEICIAIKVESAKSGKDISDIAEEAFKLWLEQKSD